MELKDFTKEKEMDDKKQVFISYHTNTAGELVHKIAEELEEKGITCWYAPRNCPLDYVEGIMKAIKDARLFLPVLNAGSMSSNHCLNEIRVAFDRENQEGNLIIQPFKADHSQPGDKITYYLGGIHFMDGTLPPEDVRVKELAARIMYLLDKNPEASASLPEERNGAVLSDAADKIYTVRGTNVFCDPAFVGRADELAEMHDKLHAYENHGKLFLAGMGGIGKSDTVRKYIQLHGSEYKVILWISYQGDLVSTIADDKLVPVDGLDRSAFPDDTDEQYYERKFRIINAICDRSTLVILDNFDTEEDQHLEDFLSGSFHAVITTRMQQYGQSYAMTAIEPVTDHKEQQEILFTEYKRAVAPGEQEALDQLIDLLAGHPLCLRLVGSAMQKRRLSPSAMLKLLQENESVMRDQNKNAADLIYGKLHQVFELSALTEEENLLLLNLAMFPISGIGVECFFDWCGFDDFDIVDGLAAKSWVVMDPILDEIHLHPLILKLMQDKLAGNPEPVSRLVDSFYAYSEGAPLYTAAEKYRILSYAIHMEGIGFTDTDILRKIYFAHAQGLYALNRSLQAMEMYRKAIQYTTDINEKAVMTDRLAQQLNHAKRGLEGVKIIQDFFSSSDLSSVGEDQKAVMTARICEGYVSAEMPEEAVHYGMMAVQMVDAANDTTPSSRAWRRFTLGQAYLAAGDLDASEKMHRESLELYDGKDDFGESFAWRELGRIAMARGDMCEAENCFKKTIDGLIVHGEEINGVQTTYRMLAEIYEKQGRSEEAAALRMKLIIKEEDVFD